MVDRIALVVHSIVIVRLLAGADYWGAGLVAIAAVYVNHAITNRS